MRGVDNGIWRRLRLIPFTATFEGDAVDADLPGKLLAELPGILTWAVSGCQEWQQRGMQTPEAVQAATNQYRNESDVIAAFLEDCCIVGGGMSEYSTPLYERFAEWANSQGEKPMSLRKFADRLKERGFEKDRHARKMRWLGLTLLSELSQGG